VCSSKLGEKLLCHRPYSKQSLIFNENESEAVRDRHISLQWVAQLFNVFFDCCADETLVHPPKLKLSNNLLILKPS